jgi:hypothetical protein
MSAADELSDDDLQTVYCLVDSIQLSRPKRNISRDFADGGKIVYPFMRCYNCPFFLQTTAIFAWIFSGVDPTNESMTYLFTRLYSFQLISSCFLCDLFFL